jgi:hypothetical protein
MSMLEALARLDLARHLSLRRQRPARRRCRVSTALMLTAAIASAVGAPALAAAATVDTAAEGVAQAAAASRATSQGQFDAQIAAMLERDGVEPPPQQAILFIGSSIFRLWADLKTQMAPLPVFNRAFGGSRTWDVLANVDRLVLPYKPKVVVYYCGSNDVNAGESAAAILGRTREFFDNVHAALPDTRILYFSINKSLDKRDKWRIVDDVNASMKAMSVKTPWITYVESNTALFDAMGQPKTELYLPDGLHFKPPAYVLFTDILKPAVTEAWRVVSSH